MTDYRDSVAKRSSQPELQTGFLGGSGPDASASLTNIDPFAPVDDPQGLTMTVRLRHGHEFVGGDDPNHCSPDNADALNAGGFIAGVGAAAGSAAAMSTVPVPGARVAALGTLAAGGIGSVTQGYLADATGGFQFSVRAKAKKKDGSKWYQLGHALPCVPTAGLVGDAKRDVQFSVYSPPEPGDWTVKVIMETRSGEKLATETRDIEVRGGADSPGGDGDKGFNVQRWALNNPVKAAGTGIVGLATTRIVVSEAMGE